MSGVLETVGLDEFEIETNNRIQFRVALSERTHEDRMKAITALRYDLTSIKLESLMELDFYQETANPGDYPFLKWALVSYSPMFGQFPA
ncbi:hypothetical protein [Dinoroseobacter sp. S375]|uniref:hypothetical protein n=1 Tax=Dinoroseobacter sp. S375 TaxID=3415136 RepID=UPI003C7AB271